MWGQQSAYHEVYHGPALLQANDYFAVTRDDTERGNICLIRDTCLHADLLMVEKSSDKTTEK